MERKVCFILDAGNQGVGGEEGGCQSKGQFLTPPPPPPPPNQWAGAFIGGGGLHAESTVSSDSHLEIGHRWSD